MKLEEQYRILEFDEFGDDRGSLVVAEGGGQDIPFEIKRVFYMYGSDPTIVRGQHANRKTEFVDRNRFVKKIIASKFAKYH